MKASAHRQRRGLPLGALARFALLVGPGLALLSDAAWLTLAALGLAIGLPLGALPMLVFVSSCVGAGLMIAWLLWSQGEHLLHALGVRAASASRLRPAVHAVAATAVAVGLLGGLAFWPEGGGDPDLRPLCRTSDLARAAVVTGSALMGHGQRRPGPDCRAMLRPDLAFLLPPWIGLALAASLLAARVRLVQQATDAADAARRRSVAASACRQRASMACDGSDPAAPGRDPAAPS